MGQLVEPQAGVVRGYGQSKTTPIERIKIAQAVDRLDPLPTEALPTCLFCKGTVIVWRENPTVCCKTAGKTIEVAEAAICTSTACGKVAVPLSPSTKNKELLYGSVEAVAVRGPTHLIVQGRRSIRPASISLVIKTSSQQTVLT